MIRTLSLLAFAAGLAVVAWVGAGYTGGHPLALAVTAAIGAFYLMGGLELRRFQQATDSLAQAVDTLPEQFADESPAPLTGWLETIHPPLRDAVRQRIEGARAGLPGPALTPYLAGFLVLLGMLGTFVGMVVTFRSTGLALEMAADLQTLRASLAAPVKGLGVAFGTSLAGIATSAMLGLLAALARRERLLAAQRLDTRIATTLRRFSPVHQREESFRLLQQQSGALPQLMDRLQTMVATLEEQHQALHERLLAGQERFHQQAEAGFTGLATSVDRSLQQTLADSARLAGAAIQPAMEATMAGIAREAAALHGRVAEQVQQQLDGVATRLAASSSDMARHWNEALDEQRRTNTTLTSGLQGTLETFGQRMDARTAALVDGVAARLGQTTEGLSMHWQDTLATQARAARELAEQTQQTLQAATAQFAGQAEALLHTAQQAQAALRAQASEQDHQRLAAWDNALARQAEAGQGLVGATREALGQTAAQFATHADTLRQHIAEAHAALEATATAREAQRLATWTAAITQHQQASQALAEQTRQALEATATRFTQQAEALHTSVAQAHAALQAEVAARDDQRLAAWAEGLAGHERSSLALAEQTRQALEQTTTQFTHHADALQQRIGTAHAALQERLATHDTERLEAWRSQLEAIATTLQTQWQQAGDEATQRQQALSDTLARTAESIATQTGAQARETVAEIARVLDAAAQAPRAAAEVIDALRDKLSDSMARDNTMLEERARMLETLHQLLNAVNHASTEQRSAIDALVSTSAELLERAGTRFAEQVQTESGRLADTAAHVSAGAAEVASLGESFGVAVQLFGRSADTLTGHLQRLDETLAKSITRSDEQLAYYVAQAREVIDLSIMSQKQIVDDLQRVAQTSAAAQATPAVEGSPA